jgi:tRNA A-37 threonylcarbamoyl transferase component Bud32
MQLASFSNESNRDASTLAKLADVRMRGRKRVMVG